MNKRVVALRFLTKTVLDPDELGHDLLDLLFTKYPDIKPEYTGHNEPFNKPITDVESALDYWWEGDFCARRRSNPRGDWFSGVDKSKNTCFSIDLTWKKSIPWYEIFCDIQGLIDPYFGYVHLFGPPESAVQRGEKRASYHDFRKFLIGLSVEEKGIHDLGWANCFGGHYLDIMPPLEKIRATGADIFEQGAGYILKFSDDIGDMLTDFDTFDHRRTAVKALFPEGTFEPYTPDEDQPPFQPLPPPPPMTVEQKEALDKEIEELLEERARRMAREELKRKANKAARIKAKEEAKKVEKDASQTKD